MRHFKKLTCLIIAFHIAGCTPIRRGIVSLFSFDDKKHAAKVDSSKFIIPAEKSSNSGDEILLQKVADGFESITDIKFLPGDSRRAVILEKSGRAVLNDFSSNQKNTVFVVKVATDSELGLLGLAFHPKFSANRKFYVHYNSRSDLSRISEWEWMGELENPGSVSAKERRILLEVNQPYQNHNGGSLVFGPDGMLYIGFGDGGWRGDPENRAQNPKTLLGKMLRIDVDSTSTNPARSYGIPKDNPFVGAKDFEPEIFALGLRNPWKYNFDSKGRLVVADVGQDKWEKITFVNKGANLGWRVFEGAHCYDPPKDCEKSMSYPHMGPIAEYDHSVGASITGGFEYNGSKVSVLRDRYVFGDFVTGRIWSIALPTKNPSTPLTVREFKYHGKWDILISTFARDADGEVYVGDFSSGSVLKIVSTM